MSSLPRSAFGQSKWAVNGWVLKKNCLRLRFIRRPRAIGAEPLGARPTSFDSLKGALLQTLRVALAALHQFNNLVCDQFCHAIPAVNKTKRFEDILKDVAHQSN
jgi:hypothetical protein